MKIFLQDIQGTILYTAYIYAKSSEASGTIKQDINNVPNIVMTEIVLTYLEIL